ncbi:phosphoribosylanthranilate isomerase [Aestuariivirga litoralis]|uniref:phosphoribosylanthranilate isomerase n=1 Tax=Aestuariivirga litoralis TaxID=2650924 RepID=UPI0018C59CF6|nr:phosphoribosylanthranilate isomerase [Aestuariivirga litoralis]MBG1233940.1 phosphoribosylanthranilate isomerase [Aestuariivirga litoralis]
MIIVKICGLSTAETMAAALDAGADMIGLVFYPRSPRNVSLEQATSLAEQARGRAKIVVLTVDADDMLIKSIINAVRPDYLQAHGSETPERVAEITSKYNVPVIKAIKVKEAGDVASAKAYKDVAALILFDAKAPEDLLPGGNGLSFDWNLLKGKDGQFMLSGGLNPDNVPHAIALTKAPMVDVSSGVETTPGNKDMALIRSFIARAKSAR